MILKVSTARNRPVFMADSSDHVTGKTGLTLTITASKDGAAFASISPTVTELANGWYNLALTTTHTNTQGAFLLHITGTGADPTDLADEVCPDLPGSATVTGGVNVTQVDGAALATHGTGYFPADARQWIGTALATPDTAGYPKVTNKAGTGTGELNLSSGVIDANVTKNAGSAITSASGVQEVKVQSMSAAAVQSIWDALTSALTTVGSIGKRIVDNLDTTVSSRSTFAGGAVASVTAAVTLTSAYDAAKTAAQVSDIPTAVQNADALLKRDWTSVTGEAARSVLNALRVLRNKVTLTATLMTVTKEDDSTTAWEAAVVTDPDAVPITSVDPTT